MESNLKKWIQCILIFLCIFVPFRELISYYTISYVKIIPDILIWGLLVIIVIKNKFNLNLKIYDIFYIAFLLFAFISTLINHISILSYLLQVRSITTMYALFYILRNSNLSLKDYAPIVNTLVGVSVFIVILGIGELITNKDLFFVYEWANSITYASNFNRVYSIMYNPNTFASFLAFVLLLLYGYSRKIKRNIPKPIYFFLFLGIYMSASRSAMIIIVLFFIFLIYDSFKHKTYKELICLLLILLLAFGACAGLEKVKMAIIEKEDPNHEIIKNYPVSPVTPSGEKENPSISTVDRWNETIMGETLKNSLEDGRLFNIKKGLSIFVDYPILGTGFGTYGSSASKMITPSLYEKYGLYDSFYSDNEYVVVLVETGIVGTLLFISFVISLFVYCLNNKHKILILFSFLFLGMMYNVLEVQAVCLVTYISFALLDAPVIKEKNKNKKDKIAILGLHLNYGGVEKAIVNQANSFVDKYDVELVITYKLQKEPVFPVNSNVKITYLTDVVPNKEKFLKVFHERKIMETFKEGLNSLKILYLKKHTMKKYIKNSDADIIISSRIEITKLLNDYAPHDVITIAEEHRHHNNDKRYIRRLRNACINIDYLIPASEELTNFYQKNILTTKSVYIPISLDYFPKKPAKLNNKNLISVGRLSKEKGYEDLIYVFNEIMKKDDKFHLDIIGDGNEKEKLNNLIKKLNLEKNITLHGYQSKEYINRYLEKASLYLMCSFEESFGIVLIEAGSFGVPAICFDSAQGANEIIENKKSGYLIANRNKKEMAKKTIELIKDSSTLKDFGKKSREIAEKYKFENVKKIWLEFLKEVKKEEL